MVSYPNRDALRDAHDICQDAMREFILKHLEKRVHRETVEELIERISGLNARDIGIQDILKIFLDSNCWNDYFEERFGYNKHQQRVIYDIRSTTRMIIKARNEFSHPGADDLDPEFTRAHLFLIADVLGEINALDEKFEVETIRNRLFSDGVEEHPAEVENASYKKRLADMSEQLAKAQAEKTECEKRLQDVQEQLAELKEIEAAWMDSEERLETKSIQLEEVEAKLLAYEKDLERTRNQLAEAEEKKIEYDEDLTEIEEFLPTEKANGTEHDEDSVEIGEHLPPNAHTPHSITFQGTTFTKYLNKYRVGEDDITQTFWNYWQAKGRSGKQEMRDAGWSVKKVNGDWEIIISPEDFQAWVENEVTELSNLFNSSRSEELSPQPVRPVYERTTLPTGKEMERPALELLANRREHRRVEIINRLTEHFSLTDDERRYLSRTGQAEKHLMNKRLIKRTRTGYYRITTRGLEVLRQNSSDVPF